MLTLNLIDKYDSDCECNVVYNDVDNVVNVAYFYVYKNYQGDLEFRDECYFVDDSALKMEAKKLVINYCENNLIPRVLSFNTEYD